MVGWHHQLNGHESKQTLGDSELWHAAFHGAANNWTRLGDLNNKVDTTSLSIPTQSPPILPSEITK